MAQATMAAIPGLKETYTQLKTRMEKAVADFGKAMVATRTGRASVHMLDGVQVDSQSISQCGNIDTAYAATIGQDPTGTYGQSAQFTLDDLAVWQRSLSSRSS